MIFLGGIRAPASRVAVVVVENLRINRLERPHHSVTKKLILDPLSAS